MRISDWSSDVCSSDLHGGDRRGSRPRLEFQGRSEDRRVRRKATPQAAIREAGDRDDADRCEDRGRQACYAARLRCAAAREPGDRKSVVSGKGVSVRVDLGGRRIMKKTINRKTT